MFSKSLKVWPLHLFFRRISSMCHGVRVIALRLTALLALTVSVPFLLQAQVVQGPTTIRSNVHHDLSLPLSVLAQQTPQEEEKELEAEPMKLVPLPPGMMQVTTDPVVQTLGPLTPSPAVGLSFEGIGQGQYGFTVGAIPPDTNGAAGKTQYVQWVNSKFAVFDKTTGALLLGPLTGNTLWSGFGGGCQSNNDGDPVVQYDKLADRWVMSQFSVSSVPYLQCVAVSKTSDATGQWYRYSFSYGNTMFDDYPKMAVWPDAYYETFDMFQNGQSYVGPDACAYDRSKMLAGLSATQVCFQQNSSLGPLLASDLDGTNPPPAGSPNYLLTFGTNSLSLFKFHVDFVTPANSTFTGPTVISVAAFSPVCGGGSCIVEPGGSKLDSLADRLMHRLAYRNFGTHESLVVTHSVTAGSSGGVRWYEIQNPSGTPVVAQQSTYAPDAAYRWMGSGAMDQAGNLAIGYSKSSSSIYPSIAFAGRLATDPVSTLQAETLVVSGTGAQSYNPNRWGDYSAMTIDPVDDCTFWYTTEYIKQNGAFNWNTRIANFKFSNCGSSVTVSPSSLTFGSQLVGTSSSSQPVTLTNLGSSSISITSIAASGDFSQSNNCGTSLAANSSCTVDVTFTPTAVGSRAGTLTITDSAGTQTVSLSGTGALNVSLSPSSYSFGSIGVGSVSGGQAFTLTNGSGVALTGISIGFTGTNAGDFAQTNNCGTTLAANSNCIITVTFAPASYGAETATLTVNDSGGTQTSTLTGTGVDVTAPVAQVTAPTNGSTVSGVVAVTATATDNVGVTAMQLYIDGALAASGSSSPLNYSWNTANVANGTHTIYATAADGAGNVGTSATITVTVNNSVQQLLLNPGFETGNLTSWNAGGALTPSVTTAKHNTGSYSAVLGSTATPEVNGDSWLYQVVTIPSTVTAASLNYSYWGVCGDTLSNDWQEAQIQSATGTLLAQVQKTCTTTSAWTRVYFNLLPYKGQTLRIYFNVHGNGNNLLTNMYVDDVTVSIKGGGPTVTLTPASLTYSNQNIGTTSASQALTLTNSLSTSLTGISIGLTGTNAGDFAETDNCGTSIAANATCTINVTFTPTAAGTRTATLTVTDSAGTQSSTLTGTGIGTVTLTPASLTYASQNIGTTSAAQALTLTNATGGTITSLSVAVTGTNAGDYAQTNTCGTSLANNASCTVNVTFTPTAAGTRTASITVTDSAGTQSSTLTGTGTWNVTLSPASVAFGSQNVGTTSSPQPVTLTNNSGAALTGISVSFTGTNAADFAQTNTCGTSLAANSTCTINVTFTPGAAGSRSATLSVTDAAGTQTSSLTGTGAGGSVTLLPGSVNFGSQGLGTTSSAQSLTLTNSSGSSLTGIGVSITGTNAGDFSQTSTCGTTLANGSSCTISARFTPSVYAAETATLTVTDSAGIQTSSLAGTGVDATAPTTQITAPASGATVSGTVTVTATASDNVGVTSVQIFVDGAQVASGTSSPLNYSWNTANASNGTHSIYSKASDAAGNVGTSTTVTVTVSNVQQLIQNSGFETGNLQNWTVGGVLTPSATTAKHNTGSYSAVLGSTSAPEANGDSSIYQTVTIPSTSIGASLNYYYWSGCTDTLSNAWQEVQVQNASGALLAQVQKSCSTSTGWTKVYFNLLPYKGQTLRIYLNAHGNGGNFLSYMFVDDVTVSVK
jgi:hypothetical protein